MSEKKPGTSSTCSTSGRCLLDDERAGFARRAGLAAQRVGERVADTGCPQRKLATMIRPRVLRKLDLETTSLDRGRPRHLAAGSGLVAIRDFLYVVADDELHLGCFPRWGDAAGTLVRLFPDELPADYAERKAAKPDIEALVRLPAFATYPHGALLAVPSGSTPTRSLGALLGLDAHGAIIGVPGCIDFSGLYSALAAQLPGLNIEGAVVIDDALLMLHRGTRAHPLSALIELSLTDVLAGLGAQDAVDSSLQHVVHWVDLGSIAAVTLSITDGVGLANGRLLVSAVAEHSADSYADGPCLGAAIAILDREGRVCELHRLQPTYKIEGVHAWLEDGHIHMLLVTDADDATIPSYLLEADLPATANRCIENAAGDKP